MVFPPLPLFFSLCLSRVPRCCFCTSQCSNIYWNRSSSSRVWLWAELQTQRTFKSGLMLINWGQRLLPDNHSRKKSFLAKSLGTCLFCLRLQGEWNCTDLIILSSRVEWLTSEGMRKGKKRTLAFTHTVFSFCFWLNVKDPFPFRLNFMLHTQEMQDSPGAHQAMLAARHEQFDCTGSN